MSLSRYLVPSICASIIFGAVLFSLLSSTEDTILAPFAEEKVSVEGVIVRDPDIREQMIRLTVRPEIINDTTVSHSKNIIVSIDRFTTVAYGDRVHANGTLKAPQSFETDSERTFNYPKYLWAHGVSYELPFAHVETVGGNQGNSVVAFLLSVKHTLIIGLERAFPEPYAALSEGLLLGEKQSLGDKLYDAFRKAGVVHIIVLSGYNVSIVIESVLFLSLLFLPRLAGFGVAGVFVLAFAVMTGGSETTIRATIMAFLMMVARILRRPAAALRGLMIAAAVMALVNPFVVLYDLSFQLSVLATFGLILFADGIAQFLTFLPKKFGLREVVATTLAAQVAVLPLLVLSIGAVSLVFLPANALILAPIPLAMLLSFLAALVSLALPSLGAFLAFPAYIILAYIITLAQFFGTLPFSIIEIPPAWTWAVLGSILLVYGIIFWFLLKKRTVLKSPRRLGS